jgi:prepilin-type N-terminal cleavage/methylation domain-containing protein
MRRRSGLTLVEVLVAASIGVVLMTAAFVMYMTSAASFDQAHERLVLNDQARRAMNLMTNELRWTTRTSSGNPSPNLSIPSSPNNKQIQFHLPEDDDGDGLYTDEDGEVEWATSDTITYQYIPGLKILRRSFKGDHTTLADNVSAVSFSDIGIDPTLGNRELKIILTLSKTTPKGKIISMTLTGIVGLRN